jgi:DNA (cytosine-5)-methyltransferase 1
MSMTVQKPAYRVPLLAEIREIPHNGLHVASTFAGCGGSSTGYRIAGYRVLAAAEFVPAAADSYQANKAPYTKLLRRDVRGLDAKELLDACGMAAGELDVLDGSPPCEPFSTAGRRDKTWRRQVEYSGQRQRTDDLFYEYARLVKGVAPRCFVAENVTGLVRGRAKGYFLRIMAALRECGYRVSARVLDASWLGVPQSRKRVIIIGVRSDLHREPAFPAPLPYQYTVRDALPHVLRMGTDPNFDRRRRELSTDDLMVSSDRPSPTVTASPASPGTTASGVSGLAEVAVEHSGYDMEARDVTDEPGPTVMAQDAGHWKVRGEIDEQIVGNDAFSPVWGSLDRPHVTVTSEPGGRQMSEVRNRATTRRRQFTIPELKRICGFPDDYVLTGSFAQQWERLGDAVPPPMAAAWARVLAQGPLSDQTAALADV